MCFKVNYVYCDLTFIQSISNITMSHFPGINLDQEDRCFTFDHLNEVQVEFAKDLISASRKGDIKKLENLLSQTNSPDVFDEEGDTALHNACIYKQTASIDILLRHGATINKQNNSLNTSLHHAVSSNDINAISLLLRRGASTNIQNDLGSTPLHYATNNNNTEAIRLLLQHGADVRVKNHLNETPLGVARRRNRQAALQLLNQN